MGSAKWLPVIGILLSISHLSLADITSTVQPVKDEVCTLKKNWTHQQICDYVNENDDICEGGGYLLWSQYVECTSSSVARVFVIIAGVIYMLYMFIMISTAADDFFSPNVAAIVAHLKISESVAGVTFMAFGNGAPDIFGSIASVLSSPDPKANLALGELLGAGVFVTCMVMATIVLTSPFKAAVFPSLRDLIFYLITVGWILFVFLYSNQVYIWQPAFCMGFYIVYVISVFVWETLSKRRKKKKRARSRLSTMRTNGSVMRRQTSVAPVPSVSIIAENGHVADEKSDILEIPNAHRASLYTKRMSIFPPVEMADMFGNEESEDEEDDVLVLHNTVYVGEEARKRASTVVPPVQVDDWQTLWSDLYDHLKPMDMEEFYESNWFSKIMMILKIPAIIMFKATIPLSECNWSKSVALIQTITGPITFAFCFGFMMTQPFDGSPGIWAYALGFSVVLFALVLFFTEIKKEPRFYKEMYSYLGFLMALGWIYFTAAEVVNVVTMIGMISGISHEILGLTILAWSNSIGDLIADIAVVKQGFPRMAMAAAIGGPLFNLLMGFGIPFLIAKAKGTYVSISFNWVYKILLIFLTSSLLITLLGLFVQRFYLRRPYAFILILNYLVFLVMVVLAGVGVF